MPTAPRPARDQLICPICQAGDFAPLDEGEFPAVRCRGCGLGIERTLSADPVAPYTRSGYDERREMGEGTPSWKRFHHDVAVADQRLRQLAEYAALPPPTAGGWVDVGCNTGAFLVQARRLGWAVGGVEADPGFCEEVAAAVGVQVMPFKLWLAGARARAHQKARDPAESQGRIAVVSFFDVLEHLLDPTEAVYAATLEVAAGGVVVVEAPDLDAASPEDFRTRAWRHRRVDKDFTEHLWYFGKQSIEKLFDRYAARGGRTAAFYRPLDGRFTYVWRKG